MTGQPLLMIFSIFRDLSSAIAAAAHVEDVIRYHGAGVDGAAVLAKDPAGKIVYHEVGKPSMPQDAARGAVLGAVVGMIFPPSLFASAFLSASISTLVDRVEDAQLGDPGLRKLGARLAAGQAAFVVVGTEAAVNQIADAHLGYESLARRRLSPRLVAAVSEPTVTSPRDSE
ncbi:MAG TPA: DUF1269 domain-containing protein [Thermomicrobiales bacterium]|jgi:uncharacterized membrane protein